jgi:hypothetical protein
MKRCLPVCTWHAHVCNARWYTSGASTVERRELTYHVTVSMWLPHMSRTQMCIWFNHSWKKGTYIYHVTVSMWLPHICHVHWCTCGAQLEDERIHITWLCACGSHIYVMYADTHLMHAQLEDESATVTISSKKMFGFSLETIKGLASSDANKALRLFLQGAQVCLDATCIYIYTHTYTYTYTFKHISDTNKALRLLLQGARYAWMLHVYIYIYIYTYTHTYIHTHQWHQQSAATVVARRSGMPGCYTHTHTHIHIHIHIHLHIHTFIHRSDERRCGCCRTALVYAWMHIRTCMSKFIYITDAPSTTCICIWSTYTHYVCVYVCMTQMHV